MSEMGHIETRTSSGLRPRHGGAKRVGRRNSTVRPEPGAIRTFHALLSCAYKPVIQRLPRATEAILT